MAAYEPEKEKPIDVLGMGGQGGVLKVRNRETGRISAFKVLCGEPRENVENEFDLMRRVDSPFISKAIGWSRFLVSDAFMIKLLQHFSDRGKSTQRSSFIRNWEEDHGKCWSIQMELASGFPLNKKAAFQKMKKADTEIIAKQMLLGISDMHKAGIAHQDIKPHNVIYDGDKKQTTIIDLGLACVDRCEPAHGTKYYFSPTRLRHKFLSRKPKWTMKQAKRDDLWAFGVVMLYVVSGNPKNEELDDITDSAVAMAKKKKWDPVTDRFNAAGKTSTYQQHMMRQLELFKGRTTPNVYRTIKLALDDRNKPDATVSDLIKRVVAP